MAHNSVFNLAEFDRDILQPAVTKLARAKSSRLRAYSFANMVSAYFWMLLGVEADYFPEEHANSLFAQRFNQFFERLKDSFTTWGYIFDPEFGLLLQTAANYRRLRQREHASVFSGVIASSAMRTALLAETNLLNSREGNAFISMLNFEPALLTQIIEKDYAFEGVDEIVLNRDAVARGFQRVWLYMETLVELSTTLQQENMAPAKRCDMRLRQLTRWRVNKHTGADEPFLRAALFVNEHYCGGTVSEMQIRNRVNLLLDGWGFTHLRAISGLA